jgi:hypothetical protein
MEVNRFNYRKTKEHIRRVDVFEYCKIRRFIILLFLIVSPSKKFQLNMNSITTDAVPLTWEICGPEYKYKQKKGKKSYQKKKEIKQLSLSTISTQTPLNNLKGCKKYPFTF